MPKSSFEENSIISDFVIKEKLGSGSIGTVYRAMQLSLERQVALKILSPELATPKCAQAFLQEARAAARLTHTNLVQSYAVGEDNGICYLAMNYISGETLKHRLDREGRIPVDEALHIVQQVAEALYYAWDEGKMIHRDVKPDNIMITTEGVVKLTDLGLAINQSDWTDDMEISGSPSYMSPEQFAGEKLDTRSDIYSLGISLYQMISGELPFRGETFQEVAHQHFSENAVPLHRLGLGISLKVSNLVKHMMEKLSEDRFEDMEALLKAIWAVRQTTAPDSDMVPDVHTISINRLEYQVPKQFSKDTPQIGELSKKIKNRRDFLFWSLLSIFPVMVAVLVTFIVCREMYREPDETARLESQLRRFEERFASRSVYPAVLIIEAQQIIESIPTVNRTPAQQVVFLNLKHYLELIDAQKKNVVLDGKNEYIKKLEDRLNDELSAKKAAESEITRIRLEMDRKNNVHTVEKQALQKHNQRQEAEVKRLQQVAKSKALDYEKDWKQLLLVQLYQMIQTREFKKAEFTLTYYSNFYGDRYRGWLDKYREWIKKLNNLDNIISGRNSRLKGMVFDKNNRITTVNSGLIYYQDVDGMVQVRGCYSFSCETMYGLIKKAVPDLDENKNNFFSDYSVLAGNLDNSKVIEGDVCAAEIAQAWIIEKIIEVKVTAASDLNAAAEDARLLLSRYSDSPLQPQIVKDLGYLLKK